MNVSAIIPDYKNTSQLPNILRETLLGSGYGKTALLLDLLAILGYKGGQKVTYSEILAVAGQFTSQHIIREGLLHFAIKRVKVKNGRKGRPTYAYILPKLGHLRFMLCGDILSPTDVLHVSDMANMIVYRKALHRELIYRSSAESADNFCSFSREYMATRLGVSQNTIRAYEKELKIYVKAQWEATSINNKADLLLVPRRKSHDGRFIEAYRRRDEKWVNLPADRGIAGLYLKKGFILTMYKRKVNKYAPSKPFSENYDWLPF